ncbi:MAG TPA: VIT1/CCC1 transporter family protein [Candidatus Thermoplasmatota archaeon]|nr:VIT1/CCC1 transporter family protein [Candidatus Thermoplasmatota archaeon]
MADGAGLAVRITARYFNFAAKGPWEGLRVRARSGGYIYPPVMRAAMESAQAAERSLSDLKAEHGHHLGSRLLGPRGEADEQSPVRNYVRDLVLGFNDGLVSVYAVTAGVAGALFSVPQILVTGVAAALAGALSMAAGEYISTKSQAEFYAAERRREEEHLEKWPHLEIQELREDLAKKGIEPPLLEEVVKAISGNRQRFLDYMMKEEFGVGQESERSPFVAGAIVMGAFLLGALVAVLPYVFFPPAWGVRASTLTSLAGLFVAGLIRARASRLPSFRAGVEMMLIGAAAGATTFIVGRIFGIVI